MTLEPADPHSGHAVGSGEERLVQDPPKLWVALGFHDSVDASNTNVALFAASQSGLDLVHRQWHIDGTDAGAEQVCSWYFRLRHSSLFPWRDVPRSGARLQSTGM